MNTVGTPLLWGGFAVVVVIMLAIDLFLQAAAALIRCR
ncbi:Inner membrane protein alx [Kluyvera cryocrescens]|uniref:Inner membrane protein alx n=1 Tax=Kluyvera cryocrescens TaxID=580 RepID=A0A485AGT4_KLUCR|nr:Inner membrane protein alx [Kluyvera cryocrescens]